MGPAVAALLQGTGGEHAHQGGGGAAQLGHGLGHGLDDGPAVDGEALVGQPEGAGAEQGQAGRETGAGILVQGLIDLASRFLVVQGVRGWVTDLEGVVDVLHRRGLVAIGVGDDEARVLLAHPGGQGPHGGGGHGLVALGEFLAGEGAQGGRVEHELGHRRPDRGAATSAGEVLPHQLPGRRGQGTAL